MPKPVEFPEQTMVFAKDQPQYLPLPAYINPDPNSMGEVVSKWQFSPDELAELQRNGGCLYITVCTFHGRRNISEDELVSAYQTIDPKTKIGVVNTGGLPPMRPDVFSPFQDIPEGVEV